MARINMLSSYAGTIINADSVLDYGYSALFAARMLSLNWITGIVKLKKSVKF